MSHSRLELEQLIAAHANRELDGNGRVRLEALIAATPAAARDEQRLLVDEIDALHRSFDAERSLRDAMLAPLEAREEADPQFRALLGAGARAESELKERATRITRIGATVVLPAPARPGLRLGGAKNVIMAAAAAILVAVGLWLMLGGERAPALTRGTPGPERLGLSIIARPEIALHEPTVSWFSVPGAASYDLLLIVGDNEIAFRKDGIPAATTTCDLQNANLASIANRRTASGGAGELRLRIVARDGMGIVIGTSGDLPVTLR